MIRTRTIMGEVEAQLVCDNCGTPHDRIFGMACVLSSRRPVRDILRHEAAEDGWGVVSRASGTEDLCTHCVLDGMTQERPG